MTCLSAVEFIDKVVSRSGINVVDNSFLSTQEISDNKDMSLLPALVLAETERLKHLAGICLNVFFPEEVVDEFDKYTLSLRRNSRKLRRESHKKIGDHRNFADAQNSYLGKRRRMASEALDDFMTARKKFRRRVMSRNLVMDFLSEGEKYRIAPIFQTIEDSLVDMPLKEDIGKNDRMIFAKSIALSYLAPTNIITRDSDFLRLVRLYPEIRHNIVNTRGLKDPAYVPSVVYIKGSEALVESPYGKQRDLVYNGNGRPIFAKLSKSS